MTQSRRKFIGAFLLTGSIIAWSFLATAIYLAWLMDFPWWVHVSYFAIAGAGWILPAMWIVKWMAAPDAPR